MDNNEEEVLHSIVDPTTNWDRILTDTGVVTSQHEVNTSTVDSIMGFDFTPRDIITSDSNEQSEAENDEENSNNELTLEEVVDEVTEQIGEEEQYPPHISPIQMENTSRFQGADWYEEMRGLNIAIIGCGGIGSYTAFLASRLQPREIALFDFDTVDNSNLSGQLFSSNSIGTSKVTAMSKFIHNYSLYNNIHEFGEFNDECYIIGYYDVIIGALDNMSVRKTLFEKWSRVGKSDSILIDGRLNAEEFQIFAMKQTDYEAKDNYRDNWLFSSEEADQTICSYKQTSFMANMIGAMINNLIVNYAYNRYYNMPLRTIPYKTYYSGPSMDFKIE